MVGVAGQAARGSDRDGRHGVTTQGTAPPTVYDVASAAGVSIATVSRVLRTPDAVREGTRDRVQAAIRSLGYVPSGNARALAGRRTGVVGLLLPGFDVVPDERPDVVTDGGVRIVDDRRHVTQPTSSNLYFDEVLRGAETEAWQRGLALMVAAGRGPSRDVIVNDVAGRVDGLAVLAQTVPDELLEHVARRIPVVVLADDRRSRGFDSISVDNAAGMRTLAAHVIGRLGIRSIAYVAGPVDSPDDQERTAGFKRALEDHGLASAAVRTVHGDFGRVRAREARPHPAGRAGAAGDRLLERPVGARRARRGPGARAPGAGRRRGDGVRRHRCRAVLGAAADHGAPADGGPRPRSRPGDRRPTGPP